MKEIIESHPETVERALAAMRETGIEDGTVVTWDDEREIGGVRVEPAWKWCIVQN